MNTASLEYQLIEYMRKRGRFMVWWAKHDEHLLRLTREDQTVRRRMLNKALKNLEFQGLAHKAERHVRGYVWKLG